MHIVHRSYDYYTYVWKYYKFLSATVNGFVHAEHANKQNVHAACGRHSLSYCLRASCFVTLTAAAAAAASVARCD